MKTLTSILIALLSIQVVAAQENTSRKDFLFENQVTKTKIKIEIRNKVAIRFTKPDATITGTILFLSDSSLILGISPEPYRQLIPFRNIAEMKVIQDAYKRYVLRVVLKNGRSMKGELIRTMQDSLTMITRNYDRTHLAASEIKFIRIRGKSSLGNAIKIGVGVGVIAGLIIGYESHPIPPQGCHDPGCFDEIGAAIVGGAIGGAVGAAAGALIGLNSSREFKIDGNQAQFDSFANEFEK